MDKHLFNYIIQLADNSLILGHRLSEWCGHGPILEQDMAITNIALDLIGQARSLYQYAAEVQGEGKTEDDLAYLRDAWNFRNVLLVEQPNTDFAYTIVRQFFFDVYNFQSYSALSKSKDATLAAIAEKSLKEVTYHQRYSSEWMIRLGDGTKVSQEKMQKAVNDLWAYTGELMVPSPADIAMLEEGIGPDLSKIKPGWEGKVSEILKMATLEQPAADLWMQQGGKEGRHSEHLGFILAELQYLQRAYPGAEW